MTSQQINNLGDESKFIPMSKESLQLEVDAMLNSIRTTVGEEYIAAVRNLWETEDIIQRYIDEGFEARNARYLAMLNSNPGHWSMELSQIRYLVLLSLTDDELMKIKATIPEVYAKDAGFESFEQRKAEVNKVADAYLQLSKIFADINFIYGVSWDSVIPQGKKTVLLQDYRIADLGDEFSTSQKSSVIDDLMHYDKETLDITMEGIQEALESLRRYEES